MACFDRKPWFIYENRLSGEGKGEGEGEGEEKGEGEGKGRYDDES